VDAIGRLVTVWNKRKGLRERFRLLIEWLLDSQSVSVSLGGRVSGMRGMKER